MEKHFAPVFEGPLFIFFSLSPEKILLNAGERERKKKNLQQNQVESEQKKAFCFFRRRACAFKTSFLEAILLYFLSRCIQK